MGEGPSSTIVEDDVSSETDVRSESPNKTILSGRRAAGLRSGPCVRPGAFNNDLCRFVRGKWTVVRRQGDGSSCLKGLYGVRGDRSGCLPAGTELEIQDT